MKQEREVTHYSKVWRQEGEKAKKWLQTDNEIQTGVVHRNVNRSFIEAV